MPKKSPRPPQDLQQILLEAQSDIGQGFFVHEDGRPLYGNEACSRITGYSWKELKALPSVFDLVVPEERTVLAERMRRRLGGEAVAERYETAIVHKSGRRVEVEVVAKTLEVGDRKRLVVLLRDITERKRLEEERLRTSEEYEKMIRVLPNVVVRWKRGDDGKAYPTYAEGALAEEFGVTTEQIVGKPLEELFLPEFHEKAMPAFERAFAGETVEFLTRIGERVFANVAMPFRADGKRASEEERALGAQEIVGYVTEVTDRERAETAMRESEERFRAIFERAASGIALTDRDGKFLQTNAALEEMLGYSSEELRCKTFAKVTHPEDVQPNLKLLREMLAGRLDRYQMEKRYVRKDGGQVWGHLTVSSIQGADGGPRLVLGMVDDITERKRAEEALRDSEERFRSLIQNSSDVITIVGADGIIRYESPAVERVLGYRPEEKVGTNALDYVHPEDLERMRRSLAGSLDVVGTTGKRFEFRSRHADGSWRRLEAVGSNLLEDPNVRGIVVNARDVTERKVLEERLQHQAFHDPLTDLPNRALLMDRLGHALARAKRRGSKVAVLFMDLDNFKYVNDSLGHEAGDELLVAVSDRLRACLRPEDTAARLGGDEFAVLVEGIEVASEAKRVAGRVIKELRAPFALEGQGVFLTPSIGIALGVGSDQDQPQALLRKADLAMYRAKGEGKARFEVFEEAMETRVVERLRLENDLRRALERGEFEVCYQPVVRLENGRIIGMEALVRWKHPERGLLSPDEFVPLAEEIGLIVPIGQRVLREACRQAKEWHERFPSDPPLIVGVNLSPRQLQHADLVEDVEGALRETGLVPQSLTLEITESALVGYEEHHVGVLRRLTELGVQLALDDFGTGYSSLSYLRRLPVGMLKIDGSFIKRLGQEPEDEVLLSGIIGIASGLGMHLLAEGVETPDQLARLRSLGCDLAQGNYFSGPLPAGAAGALLDKVKQAPSTERS